MRADRSTNRQDHKRNSPCHSKNTKWTEQRKYTEGHKREEPSYLQSYLQRQAHKNDY